MIGNAHLDPAWMWRMPEGLAAFSATCRAALDRMEETPEFIFTCSSAAHYEFVLKTDPALFERIRDAVGRDKWSLVGGWWVEPDCNLPSAEGFRRQAMLGQDFFAKHFGRIAKTGFSVDAFGHNQDLPKLLVEAGLENYVFMRPEMHEMPLDFSTFWWEAPSGDKVLAYRIPLHYSNFAKSVADKLRELPSYPTFDVSMPWMLLYGVGNHGGGPTREQIKQIQLAREQNTFEIDFSDPDRFFADARNSPAIPTFRGEFQPHAIGCYSAHSEIKRLNVVAENKLLIAERVGRLAQQHSSFKPNGEGLQRGWKGVCFNHFHDLLGGVSIREACDDAVSLYREAIAIADREQMLAAESIRSVTLRKQEGEWVSVINPTGWDAEQPVELELWHPHASERGEVLDSIVLRRDAVDHSCQKIEPSGKIGEDRVRFITMAKLPKDSVTAFQILRNQGIPATQEEQSSVDWDDPSFAVYQDDSDTWGHAIRGFDSAIGEFQRLSETRIENGPVRWLTRSRYAFRESSILVDRIEHAGPVELELRCQLDWRERHAVLKLRFAHGVKNCRALYQTPASFIERPVSSDERPGQRWFAAIDRVDEKGLALITDCKSSYSIDDDYMNVTVARSPLYAHHVPPHAVRDGESLNWLDQGIQEFRVIVRRIDSRFDPELLTSRAARLVQPLIVLT